MMFIKVIFCVAIVVCVFHESILTLYR
jgi:hypothetical protein